MSTRVLSTPVMSQEIVVYDLEDILTSRDCMVSSWLYIFLQLLGIRLPLPLLRMVIAHTIKWVMASDLSLSVNVDCLEVRVSHAEIKYLGRVWSTYSVSSAVVAG